MGRISSFGAGMPEEEVLELGGAGAARLGGCLCGTAARGREEEQGGSGQGPNLVQRHGLIPFQIWMDTPILGRDGSLTGFVHRRGNFLTRSPGHPPERPDPGTRMARPSCRIRPACSKS